ncbi:MAG TPA: AsmA-like C-terminal region-containing protein [Candidatus Binatia bacterium]
MKKHLKFLLLLMIVSIGALFVLAQSFKNLAEKNREQLRQGLQRFLGNDATFDHLEATLWGGVGFSAAGFRVADNPRFAATPLVWAKELRLGVSLVQLVMGRMVINSLTFQAPEFQVITDERGLLNLSELGVGKSDSKDLPTLRSAPSERKLLSVSFMVSKIRVNNGRVDFVDRSVKEPAEIRVKNVELEVNGLNPSAKTNIKFAAAVTEGLGHDVRIDGEFGPLRQSQDWSQQPVELEMRFDSLSAALLARALPFLRNRIPRELDVTGPLSLQAKLQGTFNRPRITDFTLKVPLFGSSNYNAILEGSMEIPEGGTWTAAQLKGNLTLNSINLAQLRGLPFLKQNLPSALSAEGPVNAYSRFEGTWANLRIGALVKADKSEIRYGDWLRKAAGTPAEFKAQISRQRNGLVLHPSELTIGDSKLTLSGMVEDVPQRLQLRLRSDSSQLAALWRLVSARSLYGVEGAVDWDIGLQKNLSSPVGWNIHGKLNLANAEFRRNEDGGKIDHINAKIAFLGTEALLEKGSFRLGSSLMAIAARVTNLTQPAARYQLQSPEINLRDLQIFPGGKSNLKNVQASGEIRWQDNAPSLNGSLSSSEGNLEDIPYRKLQGDITWSPKGMSFKNLTLQAFDGLLHIDGYWPAALEPPERFTLTSQAESVQLEALLRQEFPQFKDRIEGQLNLRGQFEGTIQNGTAPTESLQGAGESVIHQGTIRGFNLVAKILPGGDAGSSRFPASLAALLDRPDTPFDSLKANFKVSGQRIRSDDLLLVTPDYTITAAGWIGFDKRTQWNGLLVLSPRITQELQREYKLIRYLLDRRGRLAIAFRADGKFPQITVRPENRTAAQVFRRSFPQKAGESPAGGGKNTQKDEKKSWLPESLEELLKP